MMDPVRYIADLLKPGGRCLFMPNGGNLGDVLIACATMQAFDKAGLNWALYRDHRQSVTPADVVVYGGGGSLVPQYPGGTACVAALLATGAPVVVLPQSCGGHEPFWSNVQRQVTVFCRDANSLTHMQKFPAVEALAADDMAIGLDLSQNPLSTALAIRRAFAERGEAHVLTAYRGDAEAVRPPPQGSVDLSAVAHPAMTSVATIFANATAFLAALAPFSQVHTDRLHIAIGAALLGTPTVLRDNCYGKNQAVYEASLRDRFKNLRFEDG